MRNTRHLIKILFGLGLFVAVLGELALAQETKSATKSSDPSFNNGLFLQVDPGITISSLSTIVPLTFVTSVRETYYFHRNIGVTFGQDLQFRGLSTGVATYLDLPLGIEFRYRTWGNADDQGAPVQTIGVGAIFALPLSGFGSVVTSRSAVGLWLGTAMYFPISDGVSFGLAAPVKFFFSELFSGGSTSVLSVGIQASLRLQVL